MAIRDIQERFDQAAASFDAVDFVHATTREGLFARLKPMTIDAKTIVDLGSATGSAGRVLRKRFRRSTIVAIDLSMRMLEQAARRKTWFSRTGAVQADARQLPFANQSVDMVFANLLLPWVDDRTTVLAEVARVLRKDGLFLFSTLGPDSLAGIGGGPFADMHDVGDELVRAGLRDPVLDVDRLQVSWKDAESLGRDLAGMGIGEFPAADIAALELDFELVYGHAWGPGERFSPGEVRIDVGSIAKRQ